MKEKELYHKKHNQRDFEKLLESLDKVRIEPKLKKGNYKKIKAIINGGNFEV